MSRHPGPGSPPRAGSVSDILPNPQNANVLFAGAANGGVWKTTTATDPNPTWTPLTDAQPSQAISSLTYALTTGGLVDVNTVHDTTGKISSIGITYDNTGKQVNMAVPVGLKIDGKSL